MEQTTHQTQRPLNRGEAPEAAMQAGQAVEPAAVALVHVALDAQALRCPSWFLLALAGGLLGLQAL
jgi:type IV pilus biogenesis protein CpaD/CtpE